MRSGIKRTPLDRRDFSFHRSFPRGFGSLPAVLPNQDYTFDIGKTMPNQDEDGFPFGCRAYTLCDIAGNEDDSIYKIPYTCNWIAYREKTTTIQGGDIRTAMKVGQVYGVQRLDETTDTEAETHRRGAYYNVDLAPNYDWFDSFRIALRKAQKPISCGTPWFHEWATPQNGVLTASFVYNGNPNDYSWHNYEICGEKTINGIPYLIIKSWQGKNYGDCGWAYMSRESFNRAFDIYGTVAFVQGPYDPTDVYTIKLTLFQFVLLYIGRMIGLKAYA